MSPTQPRVPHRSTVVRRALVAAVAITTLGLGATGCGPQATTSTSSGTVSGGGYSAPAQATNPTTANTSPAVATGFGTISADDQCLAYLQLPSSERADFALRMSVALRANDAGNPMWSLNLDYNCGQSPHNTIRKAFGK